MPPIHHRHVRRLLVLLLLALGFGFAGTAPVSAQTPPAQPAATASCGVELVCFTLANAQGWSGATNTPLAPSLDIASGNLYSRWRFDLACDRVTGECLPFGSGSRAFLDFDGPNGPHGEYEQTQFYYGELSTGNGDPLMWGQPPRITTRVDPDEGTTSTTVEIFLADSRIETLLVEWTASWIAGNPNTPATGYNAPTYAELTQADTYRWDNYNHSLNDDPTAQACTSVSIRSETPPGPVWVAGRMRSGSHRGLPPGCTGSLTDGLSTGTKERTTILRSLELVTAVPKLDVTSYIVAAVGVPYRRVFTIVGGVPPYNYTVSTTAPGLTFSSDLVLSGTPTTAGEYTITASIADSSGYNITSVWLMDVVATTAAQPDSFATNEDTPLNATPGVLGNDSDPNGGQLSAVLVGGPAHGTLTLNLNGSFTYTPAANYNGTDSFSYKARNASGLESNAVTVTLTVNPVNDPPSAQGNSYTTNEDTALSVATPGLLANDGDIDGDTITAVLVSGPAHGVLALNPNGSFTYTPALNYNGADSFSYTARDATGAISAPAVVTLNVTAVNDPPTITVLPGGACAADFSGAAPLQLADVDTPVNNLTLSAASSSTALIPAQNITFNGGGEIRNVVVTTAPGRSGSAVVTVTVRDQALSSTATIRVVAGTGGNDTLTGTTGAHMLFGGGGQDTLTAASSRSLLCGGAGDDKLVGGADSDRIQGGDGQDQISGGAGNNVLSGGNGDDTIVGGADTDVIDGDGGQDRLDGGSGTDVLTGGAGDDQLTGGDGNDTLRGSDGNDRLTGGLGADVFDGGAGTDVATDFSAAQGDRQSNIP